MVTVDSPLKESSVAAAASAIQKINIDDDANRFVGNRIAGKIGAITFFGNIQSRRTLNGKKLWLIHYDYGDSEEVTMAQLMKQQQLYWEEKDDDTQGNTKPRGRQPPVPLYTTKRKNNITRKTAVMKKVAAKQKVVAPKKQKPLTQQQQEKEVKNCHHLN